MGAWTLRTAALWIAVETSAEMESGFGLTRVGKREDGRLDQEIE